MAAVRPSSPAAMAAVATARCRSGLRSRVARWGAGGQAAGGGLGLLGADGCRGRSLSPLKRCCS